MDKETRKKILIAAIGVGAVGTLSFFALNKEAAAKADTTDSPASTETESSAGKTKLPILKKILPKKKSKTAITNSASATTQNTTTALPQATEPFVPSDIAHALQKAGGDKNISQVISLLQRIKSRGDYNLVNKEYEKLRWWGNVSIVTDLITNYFKDDALGQQKIRNEFFRIGLVLDEATGKWSVPGNLSGVKVYKDIITMKTTYVLNTRTKQKTIVKPRTILGEHVVHGNGMTWFKALDGKLYSVPTSDIRFV